MIVETTSFDLKPREGDANYLRVKIFDEILRKVIPFESNKKLVDLGAGHCLFSKKARDFGYAVTAVDGRTVRRPDDLGAIKFVLSDVRTFDPTGYDVVLNLGLFYHLTLQDQINLLTRCNKTPYSVIETQVHDPANVGVDYTPRTFGPLTMKNGYEGVTSIENDNPMASIGNPESFWHTNKSMLKIFEDTGYKAAICIDPQFMSKYGMRRYYVLKGQ